MPVSNAARTLRLTDLVQHKDRSGLVLRFQPTNLRPDVLDRLIDSPSCIHQEHY